MTKGKTASVLLDHQINEDGVSGLFIVTARSQHSVCGVCMHIFLSSPVLLLFSHLKKLYFFYFLCNQTEFEPTELLYNS